MEIISAPSLNYDSRGETPIQLVVLHYTGMPTGEEALARMRDPAAKVSAHYMIDEVGSLYALVPEAARAWHAGRSQWKDIKDVNAASIGIELVNKGHFWGYEDFPTLQIKSLLTLLQDIISRHGVGPAQIVGHSDIAPNRKEDPGEKFPWALLAENNLALPPFEGQVRDPSDTSDISYEQVLTMLGDIGYLIEEGCPSAPVLAFQRRFYPSALGQGLSPDTRAAIAWVHQQIKSL
ncbi:MAG: N-acetylmuramoyl-L-alanine amidase [Pseudomonadota bacterium]